MATPEQIDMLREQARQDIESQEFETLYHFERLGVKKPHQGK